MLTFGFMHHPYLVCVLFGSHPYMIIFLFVLYFLVYSPMCQRAVQLADHMMQAYFANSVLVFDS